MSAFSGDRQWRAAVGWVGLGGFVGGSLMITIQMDYGGASASHLAWGAQTATTAFVAGAEHYGEFGRHMPPAFAGLAGELALSLAAGAVLGLLARFLPRKPWLYPVAAGLLYGCALWGLVRYVLAPANASAGRLFTTDLGLPQPVWWISAAVFLIATGSLVAAARATAPRADNDGRRHIAPVPVERSRPRNENVLR